jgi:hypothetical protein
MTTTYNHSVRDALRALEFGGLVLTHDDGIQVLLNRRAARYAIDKQAAAILQEDRLIDIDGNNEISLSNVGSKALDKIISHDDILKEFVKAVTASINGKDNGFRKDDLYETSTANLSLSISSEEFEDTLVISGFYDGTLGWKIGELTQEPQPFFITDDEGKVVDFPPDGVSSTIEAIQNAIAQSNPSFKR